MDPRTRLLMFKMVNAGILEKINGCISTGKESVVYHADGGRWVHQEGRPAVVPVSLVCVFTCVCVYVSLEEQPVPDEVVLKVFKTTLNEFKNRDRYIKDDYRFKERFSKLNPRKIIRLWAEKEMHNLSRYAAPCWSHCWSHRCYWCSAGVDFAGLMEAVLMEVCGFLTCFFLQDEEGRDPVSGGGAVEEAHPGHVLHWQRPRPRPQTQRRGSEQRGHEEGLLPGPLCTYGNTRRHSRTTTATTVECEYCHQQFTPSLQ